MVPLHDLAAELRSQHNRLDALEDRNSRADIRTTFSWSYERLTSAEAHVFRILGAQQSRNFSVGDVGRMANVPTTQAMNALTGLTNAHLIKEYVPGRYRFDDLIGAYAAEKAMEEIAMLGNGDCNGLPDPGHRGA
jgi:hypothetical protein